MRALLRVLRLWRAQAGWLAAGLVVSLAAVAAGVALMVASGAVLAGSPGTADGGAGVVLGVAGALAAPALLRALGASRVVLRYLERLVTHAATFRALAGLRVWFFRGLARRSAGGLGYGRTGDVLSRLVGDVEALDGLYLRILVPLAGAVLLLPALVLLIGGHNPALALVVGGLFLAAALLLPLSAARRAHAAGGRLTAAASGVRVAALDALAGLREVRAFGAEGRVLAAVQAREAAMLRAQAEVSHRASLAQAASFLCGQAAVLAVLVLSGPSVAATLIAAFLTAAAFEAVGGLPRAGALAGHAAVAAQRVLDAAEGPAAVPDPADPAPMPAGSGLAFERVTFGWRPDRPAVLDGLSFSVPAGGRVAILGPSGCGKSTLAALVLKTAAPQSGRITLGGTDLATLRAEDVRARVAYLSQATHLFADTIRANLLLGRADATDAQLWHALDQAALGDFVRALPDGLDTWVGEGGARLSGGQGRRLALARTLLSQAPVLILDEPATGLDAATERAFLSTLNEVAPGRTVVLIAHRLTGVERVDRIWRLSGGTVLAAAA